MSPEPPEDTHQVLSPTELGNLALGYIRTFCRDPDSTISYLGFWGLVKTLIFDFYLIGFINSALESSHQPRSNDVFVLVVKLSENKNPARKPAREGSGSPGRTAGGVRDFCLMKILEIQTVHQ